MDAHEIARVCHEANRAVQIIQNDPTIPVNAHWDELGTEMQASVIDGVHGILAGNDPKASHENWMKFKMARGWKWGPYKNEIKKEHPLLIPYDQLPDAAKKKDQLFEAIVRTLSDYN